MAYLQHSNWRERPGAVAAVVAIHAALGYALVTGLSFSQIVETIDNPLGYEVQVPLDPPPPPPRPERSQDATLTDPIVTAPIPPLDLIPERPLVETTPTVLPTTDLLPKVIPTPTPLPSARPDPLLAPKAASPRNDPGTWITEGDYRSSWINRELVGTVRFRLEITASGRAGTCTVTGSSGHRELDRATCDLVTRRARFEPARDQAGAATEGTYSSSVRWQLPE
ncbi:TonB family protein [Tsuneonella deserti]|nr:TonB family protein [Tsuneonella deserti]